MAERRMMSKKVIHSDDFMDLPATSKVLYFYLMIEADDDGFVNSPKRIQKMLGATDDDIKILIAKKFILTFESGVIVVKHWRMHNYIRSDRYKETSCLKEKEELTLEGNLVYQMSTVGVPSGSIGKVRLGEVRLGKNNTLSNFEKFILKLEASFTENKISTFKSKINKIKQTKEAYKQVTDEDTVITLFTDYVNRNRNMSARLDKFLLAYLENNLIDIEYSQEKKAPSGKQPQVGSIGYMMQQQQSQAIDVEVE